MVKDKTKLFRGDYSGGKKLHILFRQLKGHFDNTTPLTMKLYRFKKSLDPGRRVKIWYMRLLADNKATWTALYMAFTAKWPLPTVIEPTQDELLDCLRTTKLLEEDLGLLIEDEDKVYMHVAWAEEIHAITDAFENDKDHLIPEVHHGLPLLVRQILPAKLETWATFLTEMSMLSLDCLADELEAQDQTHQDMACHNNDWQKNINALTNHFASSAVQSPT